MLVANSLAELIAQHKVVGASPAEVFLVMFDLDVPNCEEANAPDGVYHHDCSVEACVCHYLVVFEMTTEKWRQFDSDWITCCFLFELLAHKLHKLLGGAVLFKHSEYR